MPAQSTLNEAQVLTEAAQFVLETMFFAESEPIAGPMDAPPLPSDGFIRARIWFDGDKSGHLALGLPESCARTMAASFEGIPDEAAVPHASVQQVVKELANMICGATLTRLHTDGLFRLGPPKLDPPLPALDASEDESAAAHCCWLRIPYMQDAILHLALELEEHA